MLPQSSDSCFHNLKWKGILVVIGGILVHLSLGTLYTFGNLSPYMTSYMRFNGTSSHLTYEENSWVFALACMGQGASMTLGGFIVRKLGPRWTTLLGGWCMSLGVALTYFSVQQSFALTVVTYGLLFGFGVGIAYAIPLGCAMKWFPQRKGLVNGFVVAGFGGGAFIFDQVQTAFINPDNLKPMYKEDGEKFFDQPEILEQVPYTFLLLGGCYAVMQLIGSMLVCNPPPVQVGMFVRHRAADSSSSEEDKYDEKDAIVQRKSVEINKSLPTSTDDDEDDYTFTPMQVLKSKHFYLLWFMFIFNGQGSTFVSTLYKAYGQDFIEDDTFFAIVGSFAALFNASGRIMWGAIADKFSFKVSMLLMCSCFTVLMLTFQLCQLGGKPLFFIYVCLLFGCFSGSFSLFPTATAKCFGRKYYTINYGLVFTSQIITPPVGVFLSQKLKSSLGWSGLFFLAAGFSFVSTIFAVIFDAKDKKNKEI